MTQKEFDEFLNNDVESMKVESKHFAQIMNSGELGLEAMKYIGALVERNKNLMGAMRGDDREEYMKMSAQSIIFLTKAIEDLKMGLIGLILAEVECAGGDKE
jgi:hypothetical protein